MRSRDGAYQRVHCTTGMAPAARFAKEADTLRYVRSAAGHPSGSLGTWCARYRRTAPLTSDANSYSVPWRLIGETVQVVVLGGRLIVHHAGQIVADHPVCEGRRQRIVNREHRAGVVGATGTVRLSRPLPAPPDLLRSLAEYEAVT